MIPAAIAATFRTALNARLSMVTYLGEQGWSEAAREISDAHVALAWLSEQPTQAGFSARDTRRCGLCQQIRATSDVVSGKRGLEGELWVNG